MARRTWTLDLMFKINYIVRIRILKSSPLCVLLFLLTHFLTQSPRQAPRFHWHCVLPQAPSGHILEHILQFKWCPGSSESMKLCLLWSPPTPRNIDRMILGNPFTSHSKKFPYFVLILPVAGRSLSCVGERQPGRGVFAWSLTHWVVALLIAYSLYFIA